MSTELDKILETFFDGDFPADDQMKAAKAELGKLFMDMIGADSAVGDIEALKARGDEMDIELEIRTIGANELRAELRSKLVKEFNLNEKEK